MCGKFIKFCQNCLKEHLRRLQESNQLDAEFAIEKFQEETKRYQRNYFEQPIRYNWDEGRNLKPDERLDIIDYKDKQAMLRQVAYLMQTSEKGLAGNIIYADALEALFYRMV